MTVVAEPTKTKHCDCTCGTCAWGVHCERLACRKTQPGRAYSRRKADRKREAS